MTDNNYKFIDEKIIPQRKRIFKENMKRIGKLAFSGAVFGAAAVLTGMLIYNAMGGVKLPGDSHVTVIPDVTPPTQAPSQNTGNNNVTDGDDIANSVTGFGNMSVNDYEQARQKAVEYAKLYEDTIVTVAEVKEGKDCFQNPVESSDSFSGVIFRFDNKYVYILTEYDGLELNCAYEIYFRNGESTRARILGADRETGLAVISAPLDDMNEEMLTSMRKAVIGKSTEIKEGDFVAAIGNPAGPMYSITYGVVLTKPIEKYITDRQISLFHTDMVCIGDGGGVVMDSHGNVVGIITHRFDEYNNNTISFMGVSEIEDLLDILIRNSRMPYMGITASNIDEKYLKEQCIDNGIYITNVMGGSPSSDAGLSPGDVIISINGKSINDVQTFTKILTGSKVGEVVEVEIFRSYAKKDERRIIDVLLTESMR